MNTPAWQFYPRQWLGDDQIMLMDWDARAMHLHYMCIAWQQEPACTLPDDDDALRRWANNPADWERIKKQIFGRSWKLVEGRWLQEGLLREYSKQKDNATKRSAAANTRWEGVRAELAKKISDANALQTQCSSSSSSSSTSVLKPSDADAPVDERHSPVRVQIQKTYEEKFGGKCPWDGSEAKALKNLLSANPSWASDDIGRMVENRFASEGINGTRPRVWIPRLSDYIAGPLDRFNKLISEGKHYGNKPDVYEQIRKAREANSVV